MAAPLGLTGIRATKLALANPRASTGVSKELVSRGGCTTSRFGAATGE